MLTCTSWKNEEEEKSEAVDGGSGLPSELLHCIAQRLDFLPDLISFSSVCTAWRSAGLDARTSRDWLRRQSPLLLLPPPVADPRRPSTFFSLPHGRGFELRAVAEELRSKRCIGASRDWLVLLDKEDFLGSPAELLNPFTKTRFMLPPIEKVFPFHPEAKLSGDPSSGSCVVMVYLTLWGSCICRPGDARWTIVRDLDGHSILAVNSFQASFFAVVCNCDDPDFLYRNDVVSFNLFRILNSSPPGEASADGRMVLLRHAPTCLMPGKKNLVWSLGRLILVVTLFDRNELTTIGFDVYRFDNREPGGWKEVRSIGEQAIFVGANNSVSLSTRDHPGWKANSIYFTEFYDVECRRNSGVFDLADRKISLLPVFDECWSKCLSWVIQDQNEDLMHQMPFNHS